MEVSKKPGRPKKESFESKVKNLQPISPEIMGDVVKALSSEGRKELQQEQAECREEAKKLYDLARSLEEKADSKQATLRKIDKTVAREELYNPLIRSWARRKKNNPDGWKDSVRSDLVEINKEFKLNDDVKYERLAFYRTLAQYIKDRCKFTMEDDAIRKAIQREYKLLG